ncbi:hypothetical protein ACFSJU_14060 [Paradesertivirga mongoliensis]|uniref:Ligand-binding SRPBCC domain-containing protein n=1 Tax=Paradesertivirga mongoliensis TaxID=2100740 RepID=A0ABW4ZNR2_9SPHI|nr:SRPBCC family protein [Pedobacter mongoliensis]
MHKLKQQQFLPISLEEAWNFFSNPKNLNKITPSNLVFEITSEVPETIYEGLMITYKIKPMLNISTKWCTEITLVKEKEVFVDEQRKGPYALWRHEHRFEALNEGVLMTDTLDYRIGKSVFGWVAGKLFVHKKVREIFSYRQKVLEDRFKR